MNNDMLPAGFDFDIRFVSPQDRNASLFPSPIFKFPPQTENVTLEDLPSSGTWRDGNGAAKLITAAVRAVPFTNDLTKNIDSILAIVKEKSHATLKALLARKSEERNEALRTFHSTPFCCVYDHRIAHCWSVPSTAQIANAFDDQFIIQRLIDSSPNQQTEEEQQQQLQRNPFSYLVVFDENNVHRPTQTLRPEFDEKADSLPRGCKGRFISLCTFSKNLLISLQRFYATLQLPFGGFYRRAKLTDENIILSTTGHVRLRISAKEIVSSALWKKYDKHNNDPNNNNNNNFLYREKIVRDFVHLYHFLNKLFFRDDPKNFFLQFRSLFHKFLQCLKERVKEYVKDDDLQIFNLPLNPSHLPSSPEEINDEFIKPLLESIEECRKDFDKICESDPDGKYYFQSQGNALDKLSSATLSRVVQNNNNNNNIIINNDNSTNSVNAVIVPAAGDSSSSTSIRPDLNNGDQPQIAHQINNRAFLSSAPTRSHGPSKIEHVSYGGFSGWGQQQAPDAAVASAAATTATATTSKVETTRKTETANDDNNNQSNSNDNDDNSSNNSDEQQSMYSAFSHAARMPEPSSGDVAAMPQCVIGNDWIKCRRVGKCYVGDNNLAPVLIMIDPETNQQYIQKPGSEKAGRVWLEHFVMESLPKGSLVSHGWDCVKNGDCVMSTRLFMDVAPGLNGVSLGKREIENNNNNDNDDNNKQGGKKKLEEIFSFTLRQFKTMLYDVLVELEKLHNAGIIHFDLKPDNFFVNSPGISTLIDFGCSFNMKAFVEHFRKRLLKLVETEEFVEAVNKNNFVRDEFQDQQHSFIYSAMDIHCIEFFVHQIRGKLSKLDEQQQQQTRIFSATKEDIEKIINEILPQWTDTSVYNGIYGQSPAVHNPTRYSLKSPEMHADSGGEPKFQMFTSGKSDVWSFGSLVLCYLLRRWPFEFDEGFNNNNNNNNKDGNGVGAKSQIQDAGDKEPSEEENVVIDNEGEGGLDMDIDEDGGEEKENRNLAASMQPRRVEPEIEKNGGDAAVLRQQQQQQQQQNEFQQQNSPQQELIQRYHHCFGGGAKQHLGLFDVKPEPAKEKKAARASANQKACCTPLRDPHFPVRKYIRGPNLCNHDHQNRDKLLSDQHYPPHVYFDEAVSKTDGQIERTFWTAKNNNAHLQLIQLNHYTVPAYGILRLDENNNNNKSSSFNFFKSDLQAAKQKFAEIFQEHTNKNWNNGKDQPGTLFHGDDLSEQCIEQSKDQDREQSNDRTAMTEIVINQLDRRHRGELVKKILNRCTSVEFIDVGTSMDIRLLSEQDAHEILDFIETCYTLNPAERPTVRQLIESDFFKEIRGESSDDFSPSPTSSSPPENSNMMGSSSPADSTNTIAAQVSTQPGDASFLMRKSGTNSGFFGASQSVHVDRKNNDNDEENNNSGGI